MNISNNPETFIGDLTINCKRNAYTRVWSG